MVQEAPSIASRMNVVAWAETVGRRRTPFVHAPEETLRKISGEGVNSFAMTWGTGGERPRTVGGAHLAGKQETSGGGRAIPASDCDGLAALFGVKGEGKESGARGL